MATKPTKRMRENDDADELKAANAQLLERNAQLVAENAQLRCQVASKAQPKVERKDLRAATSSCRVNAFCRNGCGTD